LRAKPDIELGARQPQRLDRHGDHRLVETVDGGAQAVELGGELADMALGMLHQAEQLVTLGIERCALGGGRRGHLCELGPQRLDLADHGVGGKLGGLAQLDMARALFLLLVKEPLGRHRPLRQRLDQACRAQQHLAVPP
jgi:hypothetical protein